MARTTNQIGSQLDKQARMRFAAQITNSVDKALGLARSMTCRSIKPTVRKASKAYRKGVSVAKKAMREIEERLVRSAGLESSFITIYPQP